MNRAEILAGYHERSLYRLQAHPLPLRAETIAIADTYFVLKTTDAEGLDINDLRGRWRVVKNAVAKMDFPNRETLAIEFANGLHVRDKIVPEYSHVAEIADLYPHVLQDKRDDTDLEEFTGINIRPLTEAAKALVVAILDLDGIFGTNRGEIWRNEAFQLGTQINAALADNEIDPHAGEVRVPHVINAVANWVALEPVTLKRY